LGQSIPTINVKPELLAWARKSRVFSEKVAAEKIGIAVQLLRQWEAGEAAPTVAQLRDAATAYKRSLAVFFLPAVPDDPSSRAPHDFRRLPGAARSRLTPELQLALRSAYVQRNAALDLADALREPPKAFERSAVAGQTPREIATHIRQLLGVTVSQQIETSRERGGYGSLKLWREAVEDAGVLVFQAPGIPTTQMRAFSIGADQYPVIVLNPKDTPLARVFSLMHEFAHLWMATEGLCNLDDGDPRDDPAEVLCNAVAAEALVPHEDLLAHPVVQAHSRTLGEWTNNELRTLARHYGVSEEVALRRLLELRRTSDEFYARKRREYLKRRPKDHERDGGPGWPVKVVSWFGRPFVRLVLTAYSRRAITASEASRQLGVKVSAFQSVAQEAMK
jgi:Zn-dependent peptidase ImmA (M78 family)